MVCHICGNETDFTCRDCDEPVCEDCCVPFTIHNQIDYPLCTYCHDGNEAAYNIEVSRERKEKEEERAKKEAQNKARRANYRKPENVEKRRLAKIERERIAKEQEKEMIERAVKMISSMFRGM